MASRFVQKLIKSAVCEAIFKSEKIMLSLLDGYKKC